MRVWLCLAIILFSPKPPAFNKVITHRADFVHSVPLQEEKQLIIKPTGHKK